MSAPELLSQIATFPENISNSCSIAICRNRSRARTATVLSEPSFDTSGSKLNVPSDPSSYVPQADIVALRHHIFFASPKGEGFPPSPTGTLNWYIRLLELWLILVPLALILAVGGGFLLLLQLEELNFIYVLALIASAFFITAGIRLMYTALGKGVGATRVFSNHLWTTVNIGMAVCLISLSLMLLKEESSEELIPMYTLAMGSIAIVPYGHLVIESLLDKRTQKPPTRRNSNST